MAGWKERVIAATEVLLDEPPPDNVSRMSKRRLTEVDVDSFMEAARDQDDPLWDYISVFLKDLARQHPIRAVKIERELAWLRHQAYKRGLHWGKKAPWRQRW